MGTTTGHQPYNGDKTFVRVAVGKIKPTTQTVTLGAAATKGATTLTVTALTGKIDAGNWLMFVTTDGQEFLAKVTDDAEVADASLTVEVPEAIPNGAIAKFPSELYDRSSVDIDRKYNTKDVFTLNTGGERQIVAVTGNKSFKAPGFWHWKNPALRILEESAENKKPVWIFIEYEAPSSAYSKGRTLTGLAVITDLPTASPADGFVSGDVSAEFTGPTVETQPVAA